MVSSESLPRVLQLANVISASTNRLQEFLSAKGLPSPSFDENASVSLPLEISADQDTILDATAELHDLLLEPLNLIHRHGGHNNSLCLQAISEFKIADMVPHNGQISFSDIAKQTPLTSEMTARILRHAMTMRVFREPEPGQVAHTAASRTLSHSAANDWLQAGTTEMWPAATKMVEALKKWPASQEPNETGYPLSNGTGETVFQVFGRDADRASLWAKGMDIFTQRPQFNLSYLTDHYDWIGLGQAQVVDIGSSQGHVALALAKKFDGLSVVVQTMEGMGESPKAPEELQGRVSFMTHDPFKPQPIGGADVYFMRWILHNWSDKYATLILRSLLPALKDGARIIIQDTLMPEPGEVALWKEKNMRATDLNMAAAFNSKDRTVAEFKTLFEKSDQGFVFRQAIQPQGSALGILEFVWQGSN